MKSGYSKVIQIPKEGANVIRKTVPHLYMKGFNEKLSDKFTTNELFIKLGFINNPRAGLVHWLPIGLSTLNKVKAVVNRRLQDAGCQEVSLALLSHSSLWQKTGRWKNNELFKLKDSSKQDFCLTATSEEEITNLVKNSITSYKDLPLIYYQIHEKFRDEKRPRMGLLRAREFLMKDAYSFDINEHEAMKSYNRMVDIYHKIFQDLKIPYVKAVADTGDIGGSLSHEWHYLDKTGEDTVFTCSECHNVSNIEKTFSFPKEITTDIETSEKFLKVGDNEYIKAIYPSTREFELSLVKAKYPQVSEVPSDFTPLNFKVVKDSRIDEKGISMVLAEEGETCFECKKGELSKTRAIEVGHTFYLGKKYTKPLDFTIPVPRNGKLEEKEVIMGCYGIGLSRIIASIGEITRDDKGFRWPAIISPWNITVVEVPSLKANVDEVYSQLNDNMLDYKQDNRQNVGLGRKINDSNKIGIPLVIILGNNYPLVDIEVRGKRYNEELEWKKLFDNKDFQWNVSKSHGIEKHTVDKDGLINVIKALLKDM